VINCLTGITPITGGDGIDLSFFSFSLFGFVITIYNGNKPKLDNII
jgi:hypothetical protein